MGNFKLMDDRFLTNEDIYHESVYPDSASIDSISLDSVPDFIYKPTADTNLYRFFKGECSTVEFARRHVKFRYSDGNDYQGIAMKEMDKKTFIFLLDDTKKYKKIKIDDISLFLDE